MRNCKKCRYSDSDPRRDYCEKCTYFIYRNLPKKEKEKFLDFEEAENESYV